MTGKFPHQYEIFLKKADADLALVQHALSLEDKQIDLDIISDFLIRTHLALALFLATALGGNRIKWGLSPAVSGAVPVLSYGELYKKCAFLNSEYWVNYPSGSGSLNLFSPSASC